jgi:hypothetical protein
MSSTKQFKILIAAIFVAVLFLFAVLRAKGPYASTSHKSKGERAKEMKQAFRLIEKKRDKISIASPTMKVSRRREGHGLDAAKPNYPQYPFLDHPLQQFFTMSSHSLTRLRLFRIEESQVWRLLR